MKKPLARSKGEMFKVLLADAVGSMYVLPGFSRAKRHSVASIRRALDGAGLLVDPVAKL